MAQRVFWIVTAGASGLSLRPPSVVYFGDPVPVIGASGAVSGFMGAAARFGLRANRREPRRGFDGPLLSIGDSLRARGVLPFLVVWIIMNIGVGLDRVRDARRVPGSPGKRISAACGGLLSHPAFRSRHRPLI
jgi:membrane associated rhomboid family serine protease